MKPRSLLRWALNGIVERRISCLICGLTAAIWGVSSEVCSAQAAAKAKGPKARAEKADKPEKGEKDSAEAPLKPPPSTAPLTPPKLTIPMAKVSPKPAGTSSNSAVANRSKTATSVATRTAPAKLATRTEDSPKAVAAKIAENHPLQPVLKLLRDSRERLSTEVKDYSSLLIKRELVGTKLVTQKLQLKLREAPFSVYLKYVTPAAGREVIFVAGENDGKLLVHEAGFASLAGTLAFHPTSKQAMADNRYPITQIGMANTLETVISQFSSDARVPHAQVKIEPATYDSLACQKIEVVHEKQHEHLRFHRSRIYLEDSQRCPIRIEQYGWPAEAGQEAPLHEEYSYTQLKLNVDLSDMDFSTDNPKYDF